MDRRHPPGKCAPVFGCLRKTESVNSGERSNAVVFIQDLVFFFFIFYMYVFRDDCC